MRCALGGLLYVSVRLFRRHSVLMEKKICPLQKGLQKFQNYSVPLSVVGTCQRLSSANTETYLLNTILNHFHPRQPSKPIFLKIQHLHFILQFPSRSSNIALAFLVSLTPITKLSCSNLFS